MERGTKLILGGLGALAAAGAGLFYLRETRAERIAYDRLDHDGLFELRAYPSLLVAETVQVGERERAMDTGFRLLARYVFAEEREGEPIAMTAPVLVEPSTDGVAGWKTRFIMPAKWTADTLPEPPPGVEINDIPARRLAAIRFSGRADDLLFADKEIELRKWIAGKWLKPAGDAEYAIYNAPIVPGPLRRNEVLIEVS